MVSFIFSQKKKKQIQTPKKLFQSFVSNFLLIYTKKSHADFEKSKSKQSI